jgi:hypothetical protein
VIHTGKSEPGEVHTTVWCFGQEVFVQATLVKYMIKRTWTKDSIPFENLKIHSLRATISLSNARPNLESHNLKNWLNLGKNYPILSLFTLLRIRYNQIELFD